MVKEMQQGLTCLLDKFSPLYRDARYYRLLWTPLQ